MATVYRLARKQNFTHGPYGTYLWEAADEYEVNAFELWYQVEKTPTNRPVPYNDGLDVDIPAHYYFGFDSVEQFRCWFDEPEDLAALHLMGYVLYELEVPDTSIMRGYRQVVFSMNTKRIVAKHSLKEVA